MSPRPPAAILPTPAALFSELRGRRVIVGVPGIGFRGDLRADDPVASRGRTFVPILTEQDYYRAEAEQVEVFAPLVPIDRVWVERLADESGDGIHSLGALDEPQRSDPIPATQAESILGRRVVHAVPDGFVRDLRAVTQVFVGNGGQRWIRICGEPEWYQWAHNGTTPSTMEVGVETLWLE